MGMKKKLRNLMAAVMAMIILISAYAPLQTEAAAVSRIRLYTFNVGHGDCHIIEFVEGSTTKFVLVDAGANKTYAPNIIKFMTSKKVTKFEYVILTHYDKDHWSSLETILTTPINGKAVTVGKYLMRDYDGVTKFADTPKKNYESVRNIINGKEGKSDKIISPSKSSNATFKIGDNITINFLNRKETYFNELAKVSNSIGLASNNDSLVFTIDFKTNSGTLKRMLFTGDIRGQAMRDYNVDSNFAGKVTNCFFMTYPHHGYINSEGHDKNYMTDRTTFITKHFQNKGTVSFVSCEPNSAILDGKNSQDIYQYFDAKNMRLLKDYIRTNTLLASSYKTETALKCTVNVETGNFATATYPNGLSIGN